MVKWGSKVLRVVVGCKGGVMSELGDKLRVK